MARPRFAKVRITYNNPPDKRGFFTLTVTRQVGGPRHKYEREVKPDDLLSSSEAASILRISVRHLYRLAKEGGLKYKKQKRHLLFLSKDVQGLAINRQRNLEQPLREPFLIN